MPRKTTPTRSKPVTAAKQEAVNQEVLAVVSSKKMPDIASSFAKAQVEVQKQLADLSASMVEKYGEMEAVEQAIQLKQEELKRLHQIEVNVNSLDQLQDEITNTRAEWEREKIFRDRALAEEEAEKAKARKRAEEEYLYQTAQKRQKETDDFKAALAKQAKENADKQELLQKQWAQREETLKAAEKELADLRALRDGLAETIKKERAAEAAIVGNSLKSQYAHEAALARKDAEVAGKLAAQTEAALKAQVTALEQANAQLRNQLDKALNDNKEIARSAVEASSGRLALEAVQRQHENQGAVPQKAGR